MDVESSRYLPPEIVALIARDLFNQRPRNDREVEWTLRQRQKYIHSFCGVSRNWYLTGIKHLYGWPYFRDSESICKFTRTLMSSVAAGDWRRIDLGSMVIMLDVGSVILEGRTVIWRLLQRVRHSLIGFLSPAMCFGYVSASAMICSLTDRVYRRSCLNELSTCRNLRIADFNRSETPSIKFSLLQETIFKLPSLQKLALPIGMSITKTDIASGGWPRNLTFLEIGSAVDALRHKIELPSTVTELALGLRFGAKPRDVVSLCQLYPHLKNFRQKTPLPTPPTLPYGFPRAYCDRPTESHIPQATVEFLGLDMQVCIITWMSHF